jgi:hypothetical protein
MLPYTLTMHSINSNQVLYEWNVHKYTLVTKSRLTMLDCTSNFEIPPRSTNLGVVHLQTPNGLQILKAPPKLFKTPPRLQKRLQQCKLAPPTHTNLQDLSLNAHKQSNL